MASNSDSCYICCTVELPMNFFFLVEGCVKSTVEIVLSYFTCKALERFSAPSGPKSL